MNKEVPSFGGISISKNEIYNCNSSENFKKVVDLDDD